MHQKRNLAPKSWPIPRKGTKFTVLNMHNKTKGVPSLIVLREMLKVAKNRTEAKKIIHDRKVSINEKQIKDEKFPLMLFDIFSVDDKSYRLILENKKFKLEETKEKGKTYKIIGKRMLSDKKIQINLNDGRNFLSNEKLKVGDSVAVDFKTGKIARIIPLKNTSEIIVIEGKKIGSYGKIGKINEENNTAEVAFGKEKVNLKLNNIMAIK